MAKSAISPENFPLHVLVWDNDHEKLEKFLTKDEHDKETFDPRGRTPLMLAVTLGHLECIRVLLKHGVNVNVINNGGWTVVHEAVASGNPEILKMVLEKRDSQRFASRIGAIPDLLQKLKSAPDFYSEMKWEFTSWIPFLSRMCPSDTYKVYKQGSKVRIDTTLLGFDQTNWVRGNRTYIFSGHEKGADLYEIDHDTRTVYCEEMKIIREDELDAYLNFDEQISARLSTPLVLTYLDTAKINFERTKGGFWGWGGSGKTETVSGYECKVFNATNVELVTKTRTEHLSEEDKKRAKSNKNPMHSFLGMKEDDKDYQKGGSSEKDQDSIPADEEFPYGGISKEEYFSEQKLNGRDIGRTKEGTCRVQKFQASLWICEDYPLSLQEQVMPIVDLMAISNTHFQKLKDFITCSFPAGFPVKIEIPLFHVMNARITFGNIFGLTSDVDGITVIQEDNAAQSTDDQDGAGANDAGARKRVSCVVDDKVFAIPNGYSRIGGQSSNQVRRQHEDDDDQLLQYAIRQSMLENEGTAAEEVDIWEALKIQGPRGNTNLDSQTSTNNSNGSYADKQLEWEIQKAIELSLASDTNDSAEDANVPAPPTTASSTGGEANNDDNDLAMALQLSRQEDEENRRRQLEEEETLKKVLELSMKEQ